MKDEEAYEAALDAVERNEDGTVDLKALVEEVASRIEFDPDDEKMAKAKRIVDRKKRPGGTESDGKICLPGMEQYAYEPRRLVTDNEGRAIEQFNAQPRHKQAEAERARMNAKRVNMHANRKSTEAATYADWYIDQLTAGRPAAMLNFQAFVMESGYWQDGAPIGDDEPEPADSED